MNLPELHVLLPRMQEPLLQDRVEATQSPLERIRVRQFPSVLAQLVPHGRRQIAVLGLEVALGDRHREAPHPSLVVADATVQGGAEVGAQPLVVGRNKPIQPAVVSVGLHERLVSLVMLQEHHPLVPAEALIEGRPTLDRHQVPQFLHHRLAQQPVVVQLDLAINSLVRGRHGQLEDRHDLTLVLMLPHTQQGAKVVRQLRRGVLAEDRHLRGPPVLHSRPARSEGVEPCCEVTDHRLADIFASAPERIRIQWQLHGGQGLVYMVLALLDQLADPTLNALMVEHELMLEVHGHALLELADVWDHLEVAQQLLIELHCLDSRLLHLCGELAHGYGVFLAVHSEEQGGEPRF
mmetsp:Transcript_76459/g.163987  ORF Transcript_76459/g.163987 Transcript_76459/m.163987 type:complete len:350 (+) Transcript_76459:360-1409(+)